MALIGTSAINEGAGAPLSTSAKTSTAGSLVVGGASTWNGSSTAETPNITSSLAGTYTKAGDKTVTNGAERVMYGLTYNQGGTRGGSHTLSVASTPDGLTNKSISWQEFDTIAAGPTVTPGTEATSAGSTTPSCSVTVLSGNATVIGIMVYLGASTTATTSATQISEADENSDFQDHFIAAKFGQSGVVTIAWTLAASRQWACYAVAFEETGGGPAFIAKQARAILQAVQRAANW